MTDLTFDDAEVAAHPSEMKVSQLGTSGRWHFAIDPIDHDKDALHAQALTISNDEALSLAREVVKHTPHLRLIPSVEHAPEAKEVLAKVIYGDGQRGWLRTIDGTPNAASYEIARNIIDAGLAVVSAGACGATVGPVPKLDGETFACARPKGHEGDHEAKDGTWFVDSVARPAGTPSVAEIFDVLDRSGFKGLATKQRVAKAIHALYAGRAPEAAPEWWTDTAQGKKTLHFEGVEWVEASEAERLDSARDDLATERGDLMAEVARLRDALEKAESVINAMRNLHALQSERHAAQLAFREKTSTLRSVERSAQATYEEYDAARQALTEGASGGESDD
ncbi:hypothetical protein ACIRON_02925 [Nocardioides sp. NPDC101246]|uniref:hypothetical protein n=1 Tax=Nocardioides sp. NPDC101246 TaxID=3364336 RepID=UPI00380EE5C4